MHLRQGGQGIWARRGGKRKKNDAKRTASGTVLHATGAGNPAAQARHPITRSLLTSRKLWQASQGRESPVARLGAWAARHDGEAGLLVGRGPGEGRRGTVHAAALSAWASSTKPLQAMSNSPSVQGSIPPSGPRSKGRDT